MPLPLVLLIWKGHQGLRECETLDGFTQLSDLAYVLWLILCPFTTFPTSPHCHRH